MDRERSNGLVAKLDWADFDFALVYCGWYG